ncbi:MAG TPA: SRPBCC family protein [Actinomycetes bacterium]|nr:SRPBCC family protein [Actinomycetes bacterium]
MTAHIAVDVVIDAPPEAVWAAVTDWPRQSEWMLGTVVRSTDLDGVGVGGGLEAFTGVGRLGFLDTMVITEWDPPRRCVVLHTGKVVKGLGIFEVVALPGGRSRFVWAEELDVPLGVLGRAGWPIVRPGFAWGVRRSLQKLARDVEAEHAAS